MNFKWKKGASYYQAKVYQRKIEKLAEKDGTTRLIIYFLDLCLETLHDEFGFDDKMLNDFKSRFVKKLECINSDVISWDDIKGNIKMGEK